MLTGEQHGFRGAGAIRAALEGEMYFYGKVTRDVVSISTYFQNHNQV